MGKIVDKISALFGPNLQSWGKYTHKFRTKITQIWDQNAIMGKIYGNIYAHFRPLFDLKMQSWGKYTQIFTPIFMDKTHDHHSWWDGRPGLP